MGDEDSEKKRKGAFFSWSRTRSTGRSQKKREHGDHADGLWGGSWAVVSRPGSHVPVLALFWGLVVTLGHVCSERPCGWVKEASLNE